MKQLILGSIPLRSARLSSELLKLPHNVLEINNGLFALVKVATVAVAADHWCGMLADAVLAGGPGGPAGLLQAAVLVLEGQVGQGSLGTARDTKRRPSGGLIVAECTPFGGQLFPSPVPLLSIARFPRSPNCTSPLRGRCS